MRCMGFWPRNVLRLEIPLGSEYTGSTSPAPWEIPLVQEAPGYWQDTVDDRPRYRISRVGFALGSLALGLLAVDGFGRSIALFRGDLHLLAMFGHPAWEWAVGAPITWGSLFGAYLLIGRFHTPGWSRRVLFLCAMNTLDLLIWSLEHAEILGLPEGARKIAGSDYLLVIGTPLNLAELILFGGLALSVISQLGNAQDAATRYRSALAVAGISAFFWMVVQLNVWDFSAGWPPLFRKIRDPATFHAYIASNLALSATALLVSIMCGQAAILCSRTLKAIELKSKEDDPFRSRSEMN